MCLIFFFFNSAGTPAIIEQEGTSIFLFTKLLDATITSSGIIPPFITCAPLHIQQCFPISIGLVIGYSSPVSVDTILCISESISSVSHPIVVPSPIVILSCAIIVLFNDIYTSFPIVNLPLI